MLKLQYLNNLQRWTSPAYPIGTKAQDARSNLCYQYRMLDGGWSGWVLEEPMTYVEAQPDQTPLQKCWRCDGVGWRRRELNPEKGVVACVECQGTGTVPAPPERMSPCPLCVGTGEVKEEATTPKRLAELITRLAERI